MPDASSPVVPDSLVQAMSKSFAQSPAGLSAIRSPQPFQRSPQAGLVSERTPAAFGGSPGAFHSSAGLAFQRSGHVSAHASPVFGMSQERQHRSNMSTPLPNGGHVRRNNPYMATADGDPLHTSGTPQAFLRSHGCSPKFSSEREYLSTHKTPVDADAPHHLDGDEEDRDAAAALAGGLAPAAVGSMKNFFDAQRGGGHGDAGFESNDDDDEEDECLELPRSAAHIAPAHRNESTLQSVKSSVTNEQPTACPKKGSKGGEQSPDIAAPPRARLLQQQLPATGCCDLPCPPGFSITVYSGDFGQHYVLPSEDVQITRGSIKYVDHLARYGAQMRFRFQLCHNYLLRKCPKLSECSYIHATKLPAPSQVHLNPFAPRRLAADRHGHGDDVVDSAQDDPAVANQYPTLPAGYTITVHPPNEAHSTTATEAHGRATVKPQDIPSDMIIWTAGAQSALDCVASGGASSRGAPGLSGARPRHCAHYQFRRVCNLGRDCKFLHSKVPFAEALRAAGNTSVATAAPPAKPQSPQLAKKASPGWNKQLSPQPFVPFPSAFVYPMPGFAYVVPYAAGFPQ
jgi:hypothetical protein